MAGLTIKDFLEEIKKKLGDVTKFKFNSFLFLKIQNSYVLDEKLAELDKKVDFLCINLSGKVDTQIQFVINQFLYYLSEDTISYSGYYRILFELLSTRTKINSFLLINRKGEFLLPEINSDKPLKINKQGRILYLLYIIYRNEGLSKKDFLDANEDKSNRLSQNVRILYNYFYKGDNKQEYDEEARKFIKSMTKDVNRNMAIYSIRNSFKEVKSLENPADFFPHHHDEKHPIDLKNIDHPKDMEKEKYHLNFPLKKIYESFGGSKKLNL